jgi:hypothetical protein
MFSKYNGTAQTLLTFNADGGSSYGTQDLTGKDTIIGAQRTATTSINLTDAASANGSVGFGEYIIKAKSGKQRTIVSRRTSPIATTVVGSIGLMGGTWTNTADNLTSMTLTNANLDTGTHILLFKRTPIGSVATSGMRTGDITIAGTLSAGCMQKIYSTTLLASASSVSVTGLSGNTDIIYEVRGRIVSAQANCNYGIRPNNLSDAGTYGKQTISGFSGTASAIRVTGSSVLVTETGDNDAGNIVQFNSLVYATNSAARVMIVESCEKMSGTTCTQVNLIGGVHNDTSSNYTSVSVTSSVSGGLDSGSYVELWSLRKHS